MWSICPPVHFESVCVSIVAGRFRKYLINFIDALLNSRVHFICMKMHKVERSRDSAHKYVHTNAVAFFLLKTICHALLPLLLRASDAAPPFEMQMTIIRRKEETKKDHFNWHWLVILMTISIFQYNDMQSWLQQLFDRLRKQFHSIYTFKHKRANARASSTHCNA